MQDPDRVGAERETRADLAQNMSLLVDVGIEARLAKCEGGRQPSNPGANNKDAHGGLQPAKAPSPTCATAPTLGDSNGRMIALAQAWTPDLPVCMRRQICRSALAG